MTYTNSFHERGIVDDKHNRREKKACENKPHIDPNGDHESWIDIEPEVAYEQIFGKALWDYNQKQTREKRKITSYYQHVTDERSRYLEKYGKSNRDKKTKLNCKKPVYECVVQVGNKDVQPPAETCKTILKQFLDDFKKQNPNLKVIGAYYHGDELTPHMHLDFVPVASGYQRGLAIQNSLTKALQQEGYEKTFENGREVYETEQFWRVEQQRLTSICRQYGIEIENPKRDKSQYVSSEVMKHYRYKEMELEKKIEQEVEKRLPVAIKDKEQTIEMDYHILEYLVKNSDGQYSTKSDVLEKINKKIKRIAEADHLIGAINKAPNNQTIGEFKANYKRPQHYQQKDTAIER